MLYMTALFLFFLLHLSLVDRVSANDDFDLTSLEYSAWSVERGALTNRIPVNSSCLICNVGAADVQYGFNQIGSVNEFLACMTESSQEPDGMANQVYALDQLPKAFIRQYKRQLYSGNSRICIHQGRASRHTHQVLVPSTSVIQILPASNGPVRRSLYPSTGQNTVLVVRVTSIAGEDPGLTASQLEGTIFGTGSEAQNATLVSQYSACSQSKWNLVPATGNNIVNGVLEVQYQGTVNGSLINGGPIQSAINQLVVQAVGVSKLSQAADHILFCLPNGSEVAKNNSGWIAFTYLGNIVSYFQQGWCQRLSAQTHEVGHQIGFRHSGWGNMEYGDQSCTMGSSFPVTGHPQECFNGHKNWLSGWFEDSKVLIDPINAGAWVGNLVAFVDYPLRSNITNGVTIIKVGYLYIQFNSAKKYNYQVVANRNRITVVENNATALWSNILVGLSSGQTYTYANFSKTGFNLVIKVCSINYGVVDFAKVSLYLNDGVQTSLCASPVSPLPTRLPTSLPSYAPPTPPPTPRPSRLPTFLPTSKPTKTPTLLPTAAPTNPVARPTPRPTSSPSGKPTTIPTATPTPPPTVSPTVTPFVNSPIEISTPAPIRPLPTAAVPTPTPRTRTPRPRRRRPIARTAPPTVAPTPTSTAPPA